MRLHFLPLFLLPSAAAALSVNVYVTNEICTSQNGMADAQPVGGVPPYTFDWSNGAITEDISGLSAGLYTVTVTDFVGTQATNAGTVQSVGWNLYDDGSGNGACPGDPLFDAYFALNPLTLAWPLSVPEPVYFQLPTDLGWDSGQGTTLYFPLLDGYAPGTYLQLPFTDGNGCPGTLSGYVHAEVQWLNLTVLDVEGACANAPNGSIQLFAPLEADQNRIFLWHNAPNNANNTFIAQVGEWQATTVDITGLVPGDHWIVQQIANNDYWPTWGCKDSILVTVPDLGGMCGNVSGTVFMDYNADCNDAWAEPGVPNTIIEFNPGPFYATTNADGDYSINLPLGTYQVDQQVTDIAQHCPPPPSMITVTGLHTLDMADTSLVPLDVTVAIASGPARPGFQLQYAIDLDNVTPSASGALMVVMDFDPAVSYLNASPTPTSVVGTTITWNTAQLTAFGHQDLFVSLQVPPDLLLVGTTLNATANVATANADAIMANNSTSTAVLVTASVDPNDKQVLTSSRWSALEYYIGTDEWLDYTIRFQNTGTDTAFTVIVTDTLADELDPATIQWGAASHGCTKALEGSGVVKFIFPNILLPDSNVNEPLSHGFVSFRIKPMQPLLAGTVMSNNADIFFDFNPPVRTNDAVVVATQSTAVVNETVDAFMLVPNPAQDQVFIVGPQESEQVRNVEVMTPDGRVVLSMTLSGTNDPLDVTTLAAGAYLVVVHAPRGARQVLPLLKW